MKTDDYISTFFPFGTSSVMQTNYTYDGTLVSGSIMALDMTLIKELHGMKLCIGPDYAEPYEWIVQQVRDWAFSLLTSYFYYKDFDKLSDETKSFQRKSFAAFDGVIPHYHIELRDEPEIVWDFHLLLLAIQIMSNFEITDNTSSIKICDNCLKAFITSQAFCSTQCEMQHIAKSNNNG